jgi:hypothetical protein
MKYFGNRIKKRYNSGESEEEEEELIWTYKITFFKWNDFISY